MAIPRSHQMTHLLKTILTRSKGLPIQDLQFWILHNLKSVLYLFTCVALLSNLIIDMVSFVITDNSATWLLYSIGLMFSGGILFYSLALLLYYKDKILRLMFLSQVLNIPNIVLVLYFDNYFVNVFNSLKFVLNLYIMFLLMRYFYDKRF